MTRTLNLYGISALMTITAFLIAAAYAPAAMGAPAQGMPGASRNAQAVKEVADGKRPVANAAWWGFDPQDSTQALQAAIDSKARTVIVPNLGKPWIVRPIKLRSNLELVLEEGTIILAKKGEFQHVNDSLLFTKRATNLTIRGLGSGATLRMHKDDYAHAPYKKSEWRMGINLRSCSNVTIENLTVADSGGDGIYLGSVGKEYPNCENIVIRNVVCDNNYRQGISVICADGLLIENCRFKNTSGTGPAAGLDFEPNHWWENLKNIKVRHCISSNNQGPGYMFYLWAYDHPKAAPVSIHLEHCKVEGGDSSAVRIGLIRPTAPKGDILFTDCSFADTARAGAFILEKSKQGPHVRFERCQFKNVANGHPSDKMKEHTRAAYAAPLVMYARSGPSSHAQNGGITFDHCYIQDDQDRPALVAISKRTGPSVEDLSGTITVEGPGKARAEFGQTPKNVHLNLIDAKGAAD